MSHLARSIRRCLALATVTTTSLCAGTAFAATNELEEIVVTAQKQEQKLSETPLSVTALSSTDLQALAATQFRDFANTVPGLGFTSEGRGGSAPSDRFLLGMSGSAAAVDDADLVSLR